MTKVENSNGELVESKGIGPSGAHLVGEPRNTTIRRLIKDDYGYDTLAAAQAAGDVGVVSRANDLLAHRGYDDPITIQENEDGYDEIIKG